MEILEILSIVIIFFLIMGLAVILLVFKKKNKSYERLKKKYSISRTSELKLDSQINGLKQYKKFQKFLSLNLKPIAQMLHMNESLNVTFMMFPFKKTVFDRALKKDQDREGIKLEENVYIYVQDEMILFIELTDENNCQIQIKFLLSKKGEIVSKSIKIPGPQIKQETEKIINKRKIEIGKCIQKPLGIQRGDYKFEFIDK